MKGGQMDISERCRFCDCVSQGKNRKQRLKGEINKLIINREYSGKFDFEGFSVTYRFVGGEGTLSGEIRKNDELVYSIDWDLHKNEMKLI
jgi:hypothetical protein